MLRDIFSKIFLCFLLCSFIFLCFPESGHAQVSNLTNLNCSPTKDPNVFSCVEQDCSMTGPGSDIPCQSNTVQKTRDEIAQIKKDNPGAVIANTADSSSSGCGIWSFSLTSCITSVFNFIFTWILKTINWFLGQLIWLASLAFDFTVYFTIVKFKTNFSELKLVGLGGVLFGNTGSGLIYYLWGMIRDFLNIIIFLTIMYSAVQSMFEGFENTRRKFIGLLVFSIVANFSLLFVKIAIDVSNILALQAYTLAVKPTSTESFSKFRNIGGAGVTSYGEYIMNSVDLNKLTDENKGNEVAKAQISKTQDTFIFQLGRMIVYIGIIYILVFMAGLLITRAGVLLYAMIISPLIAADLFFKLIDPVNETTVIAKSVRNITNKIRGDFYDALIKGPLLIFFIFLIGVFAESILSKGVLDTLNSSLDQMKDVKNVSSPFTTSLFVFFKFAIFLTLSKLLFDGLNNIKLAGESGSRLRGWGGKIANQILGRGLGGLARGGSLLGRNTIGRAASNPNSGLGQILNRLDNNQTIARWKTSDNAITKTVGTTIGSATRALRTGTYDARNAKILPSKLGTAVGAAAGNAVKGITGDKSSKIDFGTARKLGYQDAIAERVKKSKEDIDKKISEAGKDFKATQQEIKDAKDQTTVKEAGDKSLSNVEELLSSKDFRDKLLSNNPADVQQVMTMNNLTPESADFFKKALQKDPDILNKIDSAREKADKIADKSVVERRQKEVERIKKEVEESIKPGKTVMQKIQRTGSTPGELLGDAITGNRTDIQEGVAKEFRKEFKKESREEIKKFSILSDEKKDLDESLKQIESALKIDNIPLDLKTSLEEQRLQLKKVLEGDLESGVSPLFGLNNKMKDEDKIKAIETFSNRDNIREGIIKAKEDASKVLSNVYGTDDPTNTYKDSMKTIFDELTRKRNAANVELKTLARVQVGDPGTPSYDSYKARLSVAETEFKKYNDLVEKRKDNFEKAGKIFEKAGKSKEKFDANFGKAKTEENKVETPKK